MGAFTDELERLMQAMEDDIRKEVAWWFDMYLMWGWTGPVSDDLLPTQRRKARLWRAILAEMWRRG
jgi:hypothetical protein